MSWKIFSLQSLKTRITLSTLVIFLAGIWALSFYATEALHDDMERLVCAQQFSTASFIADEVDDELRHRLVALERYSSGRIDRFALANLGTLQSQLDGSPVLQGFFNGGVWIGDHEGTVVASSLRALIGKNYAEREYVAVALKDGKSVISKPIIGKVLKDRIFVLAVPIRSADGHIVGVLAGVTDLGRDNFLDRITKGSYGNTGVYFLLAPQYRMVITSSDKSRVMQPLPALGLNPAIDRFEAGYEGSAVVVNGVGVEVLTSSKRVPIAGWTVSVSLPVEEAFAPIRDLRKRIFFATALLTVLAGALTWLILRWQLAPMLTTAQALARLADSTQPPQALPIVRHDEVGELIGGFNRLLDHLARREANHQATLAAIPDLLFDVGLDGRYYDFHSSRNDLLVAPPDVIIGRTMSEFLSADAVAVANAALHEANETGFSKGMQMQVAYPGGVGWFELSVARKPAMDNEQPRFIVISRDVTERKQAELERENQRELLIREVHHRIKNNLQGVSGLLQRELGKYLERDQRLEAAVSQINSVAAVHGLQGNHSGEAIWLSDCVRHICAAVSDLTQRVVIYESESTSDHAVQARVGDAEAVSVALVLNELIVNAVKHSPSGGASPRVSIKYDSGAVQIAIQNPVTGTEALGLETGKDFGNGLRLVHSLLPKHGAALTYTRAASADLIATLTLTHPVVKTVSRQESEIL